MPVLNDPKTGVKVLPSSRTFERVRFKFASSSYSAIDFSVLT